MPVFRFLTAVMLLVAVVALVHDLTPAFYGAGPLNATSISGHWEQIAPSSRKAAETAVSASVGAWVWSLMQALLLSWPTFLVFGGLAAVCGLFGRRRRRVEIFVN